MVDTADDAASELRGSRTAGSVPASSAATAPADACHLCVSCVTLMYFSAKLSQERDAAWEGLHPQMCHNGSERPCEKKDSEQLNLF